MNICEGQVYIDTKLNFPYNHSIKKGFLITITLRFEGRP